MGSPSPFSDTTPPPPLMLRSHFPIRTLPRLLQQLPGGLLPKLSALSYTLLPQEPCETADIRQRIWIRNLASSLVYKMGVELNSNVPCFHYLILLFHKPIVVSIAYNFKYKDFILILKILQNITHNSPPPCPQTTLQETWITSCIVSRSHASF